ncbi:glycine cleavage system aminomethyltransferase GcvT [Herbaspirillum sp. RTI4]|uniref:glycine cleavage system aminomethyltransferase GcvT n=1 Tax=Herbaspirillum sp. RTI4 TaxID=3048640 RepID=UPI002AB4B0C4|nr:glycine cleavage system aminomethyltransferase GcvT [Herbaspirillum sp. RTI4]MDY7579116.1 glycine cleavage system aminomethyltransferase GcvT [Herbaspirillum sp. RTI4]MEA9981305.1 glycine cleavage system aminomethyltransferase GcvT [Herbaspirillum sp. RTI4]
MTTTPTPAQTLRRTPLYRLHLELGGKMVPFAGYEMPVYYPLGILKEHIHTRAKAGLFDVSHMGQVRLSGADASAALETLAPIDIIDLPTGMQRYALFTAEDGGILDDLMVARLAHDELFVVVNAACKEQDIAHMKLNLASRCQVQELTDHALLALQGPAAAAVLARLHPGVADLKFMQISRFDLDGVRCVISRSGYTGEDGYEISVPSADAEALARRLLTEPEVEAIGLGARDSLRLEAGLCLYSHDIDTDTTPIEGSLLWAISRVRRPGGARAGGYPGDAIIARQIAEGVERKRIGFIVKEKMPVREGSAITDLEGNVIGKVTSGTFGPSYGGPLGLGYVTTAHAVPGTALFALVRGKRVAIEISLPPFVPQHYHRG